jgi:CRP-like cAMP-binding protein
VISKNTVIVVSEDIIEFIVRNLSFLLFLPEDQVIRQGENGEQMFFLAKGDVDIWVLSEAKKDCFVNSIKPGGLFGEVALMTHGKRTATVKCKNYCTIASIVNEKFHDLCENFPDVKQQLKNNLYNYQDRWKLFLIVSVQVFIIRNLYKMWTTSRIAKHKI